MTDPKPLDFEPTTVGKVMQRAPRLAPMGVAGLGWIVALSILAFVLWRPVKKADASSQDSNAKPQPTQAKADSPSQDLNPKQLPAQAHKAESALVFRVGTTPRQFLENLEHADPAVGHDFLEAMADIYIERYGQEESESKSDSKCAPEEPDSTGRQDKPVRVLLAARPLSSYSMTHSSEAAYQPHSEGVRPVLLPGGIRASFRYKPSQNVQ